jgi:hypothetical protein
MSITPSVVCVPVTLSPDTAADLAGCHTSGWVLRVIR